MSIFRRRTCALFAITSVLLLSACGDDPEESEDLPIPPDQGNTIQACAHPGAFSGNDSLIVTRQGESEESTLRKDRLRSGDGSFSWMLLLPGEGPSSASRVMDRFFPDGARTVAGERNAAFESLQRRSGKSRLVYDRRVEGEIVWDDLLRVVASMDCRAKSLDLDRSRGDAMKMAGFSNGSAYATCACAVYDGCDGAITIGDRTSFDSCRHTLDVIRREADGDLRVSEAVFADRYGISKDGFRQLGLRFDVSDMRWASVNFQGDSLARATRDNAATYRRQLDFIGTNLPGGNHGSVPSGREWRAARDLILGR